MKRPSCLVSMMAMLALSSLVACTESWIEDNPDYHPYKPYDPNQYGQGSSGGQYPDGGGPPTGCFDPSGFGGKGCYACEPKTNDELLTACTKSKFETFDNAKRINGFNPQSPKPTIPAQGPALPPYAGETTTTTTLPPAPACPIDTKPNPVMVLGGTGFPLETIAKAMGTNATIFYAERGSCEGVAGMVINAPKLSGEIVYFDSDGTENRCTLQQSHPADITTSALFAESCVNQDGLPPAMVLPADVTDFLGPVSTVMFAVPAMSNERAISAEAAYRVYGMSASGVAPWSEERFVFRRRASSGNQQTVALTLGLPFEALRGRDSNGSSNMLNAIRESDTPQGTIGISSSEIVDPHRDTVKALAYQHAKQPVAFYPDSDPAMLDRRNVRDGHYFMWMPLHVLSRTNASAGGDPVAASNPTLDPSGTKKALRDATVKRLVYVMVNRQAAPVPSIDLFGALKRLGNVPQCAMRVRRAKEGAPLEPYTPPAACGCAFEAAAPGQTGSSCTSCRTSSECTKSGQVCSFGFCE